MNDPMEINKPAQKSKLLTSLQKNRSYLISLVLSILVALIIGGILMAVTGYNSTWGEKVSCISEDWLPL